MSRATNRMMAAVLGASVALATTVLGASPAAAYVDCSTVDRYAHQSTQKIYKGMYGVFYTYDNAPVDGTQTFSLSHLYAHVDGASSWFIEVGYFKGLGATLSSTNNPPRYYSAMQDSITSYVEKDFDYPTIGSNRQYQLIYAGYNYNTGRNKWSAYRATLSTPVWQWEHRDMPAGIAISGGEVGSGSPSGTRLGFKGTPSHQLLDGNGIWHDWTPSYMSSRGDTTYACDDPGFTGGYTSYYTDFYFRGNTV